MLPDYECLIGEEASPEGGRLDKRLRKAQLGNPGEVEPVGDDVRCANTSGLAGA